MPFDPKAVVAKIRQEKHLKQQMEPCKCKLLVKACQSGKTSEAIKGLGHRTV